MRTAIRKHLRDFVAVAALLVVALVVTVYIVQNQRLRIPVLEEKPFELKAEFQTAQAVVPGQGQTIRVAGVRVGDVSDVPLENGVGVVTFEIDRKFLPIYQRRDDPDAADDRPQGHVLRARPGHRERPASSRRATRSRSPTRRRTSTSTRSSSALDSDTQAYLQLLLVGAGKGLDGRDKDLGKLLGRLGPHQQGPRRSSTPRSPSARRTSPTDPQLQPADDARSASRDRDLTELVASSNGALGAIAEQDPNVRRAVSLLPGTLQTRRPTTLNHTSQLAVELGPGVRRTAPVRPQPRRAQRVDSTQLAESTTPVLQNEIRPFVRAARGPVHDLRTAARRYSAGDPAADHGRGQDQPPRRTWPPTTRNGAEPPGTPGRDEGYLYWARVARPQRQLRLLTPGRQRLLPPHLFHDRLRPGAGDRPGRHAGRAVPARDRHRPHRPDQDCSAQAYPATPTTDEMQKQAPSLARDPDRRRLRAVVLRADPVPLGRLRRADPAEARELPDHRLLPGGDPARRSSPTCGSAASRSAR